MSAAERFSGGSRRPSRWRRPRADRLVWPADRSSGLGPRIGDDRGPTMSWRLVNSATTATAIDWRLRLPTDDGRRHLPHVASAPSCFASCNVTLRRFSIPLPATVSNPRSMPGQLGYPRDELIVSTISSPPYFLVRDGTIQSSLSHLQPQYTSSSSIPAPTATTLIKRRATSRVT